MIVPTSLSFIVIMGTCQCAYQHVYQPDIWFTGCLINIILELSIPLEQETGIKFEHNIMYNGWILASSIVEPFIYL